MGLGLLLVPALGGYWFLTHLHYTRFRAVRDSGYHVLFQSALVGGVLFVIAQAALIGLNHLFPQIAAVWKPYFPVPYSDAVMLSVLLGLALPVLGNLIYGSDQAALRAAKRSGDLIELLISESINERKLVEMSLRSGKSYIGFALDSGITRQGEADVSLVPFASGYRDKDTQELEVTTNYSPVIEEYIGQSSDIGDEDFRIVIPISEVVSVRFFFPEAYKRFQSAKFIENVHQVIAG